MRIQKFDDRIGAVFLVVLWALFFSVCALMENMSTAMSSWPKTKGVITDCEQIRLDPIKYRVVLKYSYSVDGAVLSSLQTRNNTDDSYCEQHAKGDELDVAYDPRNPGNNALEPISPAGIRSAKLVGGVFLILNVCVLVGAGIFGKLKTKLSANKRSLS